MKERFKNMKIKELIKGKVTNIKKEFFEEEFFEKEQEEIDDLFMGKDYIFYVSEGILYNDILGNLFAIVGHEALLIYNKDTKEFSENSIR